MNLWKTEKWREKYDMTRIRGGLRLRCDSGIDCEVRRACKEFCYWLRKEYKFPVRVPIYLKNQDRIRAKDGELVTAIFCGPYNKYHEPHIRIAVGDYQELLLLNPEDKDNILAGYLCSIAHELTHYYQWLNDIELTPIGEERQAVRYGEFILNEYAQTREHP